MSIAFSLNIGINRLSPMSYDRLSEEIFPAEADALAMFQIAKELKYDHTHLMLTREATKLAFRSKMREIASVLEKGDFFLLTFSGQGRETMYILGDEADDLDDSWCFYDDIIIGDELHDMLTGFKKGVRILIFSDIYFSGGINRSEIISDIESLSLWEGKTTKLNLTDINASVRFISSCQEFEFLFRRINKHSYFTGVLVKVWNNGEFSGNYSDFHLEIMREMLRTRNQIPNHIVAGLIDVEYDECKPFIPPKYTKL